MIRRFILCLGLVMAATAAQAAGTGGKFSVKGAGLVECRQYTTAREQNSPLVYSMLGWLDGYVSAFNEFTPDTFDVAAWESTDLFSRILDKHCRENPSDRFFAVVRSLVAQISAKRIREDTPLVAAQRGGDTVIVYQETLRRVQKTLADQGLYKGDIDGQFGEPTWTALESFQAQEGLKQSGLPDQVTLWRLFRPSDHQ